MADSDFLVLTLEEQLPFLGDQVIKHGVFLSDLKEAGRVMMGCGGDGYQLRVRKSKSALVRAIGDNTAGQAKTIATLQELEGDYAAYGAELLLSRLQQRRNEGADAKARIADLFTTQVDEVFQEFAERLNTDSHGDGTAATGDEASPWVGLAGAIGSQANTYIGVDRSSATWWQPQSVTIASGFGNDANADGVTDGVAGMRTLWLACCAGYAPDKGIPRDVATKVQKPDRIYTTALAFANFSNALQSQQIYTSGKGDPGMELSFFGVPVKWDNFVTADKLRMVCLRSFQVRVVGSSIIYQDNKAELGFSGQPRATAIGLVHQGAIICAFPRYNGTLNGVDTA
jgi:hypothetical protein